MATRRQRWTVTLGVVCAAAVGWWLLQDEPEAPAPPVETVAKAVTARRPIAKPPRAARPPAKPLPKDSGDAQAAEDDGGTPTQTADPRTTLTVHVVERDGNPVEGAQIVSNDCNLWRPARNGTATLLLEPDQVCTIKGGRRDGVLVAWSEPEVVEGGFSDEEIFLEVPSERTAGLGISIAEHEYGILVRHVFPGSPAGAAGILAGDVIVELNRHDTAEMSLDAFISQATGPVDTEVEVVVGRTRQDDSWEEFSAVITRRAIERPRG